MDPETEATHFNNNSMLSSGSQMFQYCRTRAKSYRVIYENVKATEDKFFFKMKILLKTAHTFFENIYAEGK